MKRAKKATPAEATKSWRVYGTVVGGTFIGEFKADSGAEAIDKAMADSHVSFCFQCSDSCEDPQILQAVAERDIGPNEFDTVTVDFGLEDGWESKAKAAGWRPPRKAKS